MLKSMELKGKITIFPEMKEGKNDKGESENYIVCRGTISSKSESGEYLNKSVNVRFAGSNFPKDKVNKLNPEKCYKLEIEEGFLSVVQVKERRDLEIVVLKGKLSDPKLVNRVAPEEKPVDADIPF